MKRNIQDVIGFLISRNQAKLQNHFLQKLKPYGVTPEQWVIFSMLSEEEGISPTELAQMSYRDKPYTTRLIDRMEKSRLIQRVERQNDKRSSLLFLTKQGAELKKKLIPIADEMNQWVIETMSQEEIKQLKNLLSKLLDHLKD